MWAVVTSKPAIFTSGSKTGIEIYDSYYTCMHRQREDRLSMITFQTFRMTTLCFTIIFSHWCSGDPSWEELIMPRPHPSLCSPLQFQTVSLWCQELELHETAWQCMTVHDGRSGSFMTLYCRKACNHYSSTGQLFQYAADQHINRKHHLFVLPSCSAFIILFSLSLHSDWHRGPNTQTNSITRLHSQILCSMHTLSTQIHSFLYSMHQSINNEHVGKQFSACSKTNVNFIYFWSYMKDSVQWA